MRVLNKSRETELASSCNVADTFLKRFIGLMGKKNLETGSGLLITPCNSIHMFFMKFPLDIVFLDRSNTVLYMVAGIKPWRVTKIVNNAHSVLELPARAIEASGTQPGDTLEIAGA